MKPAAQLTLGFAAAAALMAGAVWLWVHNLIIFAAPVGALALGSAWVGVDNALIYPAQRAQRMPSLPADGDLVAGTPPSPSPPDSTGVTVPH